MAVAAYGNDFELSFGKHRGTRASALPEDYFDWLSREARSSWLRRRLAALRAEMTARREAFAAGREAACALWRDAGALLDEPSAHERLHVEALLALPCEQVPVLFAAPAWMVRDGFISRAWCGSREALLGQAVRLHRENARYAREVAGLLCACDSWSPETLVADADGPWLLQAVLHCPSND